MTGQITLWMVLDPKCTDCPYEEIDRYCGLGMCRHPLVMHVHWRTRGKFSARYDPDRDRPEWCPIIDPERWEVYKC